MEYTKYQNVSYNLHVINTDKFKTNMIKINFKKKLNKKDITLANLLSKVLLFSTKDYQSKRDLEIKTEELYNLSMSAKTSISGNFLVTSINSIFLNEKYTESGMTDLSIKFVLDTIFKPNVNNKDFAFFNLSKNIIEDELNTIKENPRGYALLRMYEEMDKERPHNSTGYMDDLIKITSDDLYDYYKDLLRSSIIDIFIIGDIKANKINDSINNLFEINTLKRPVEQHFITYTDKSKKIKEVSELLPLEQAKLSIGIKLMDLNDFERKYVMYVYNYILGGSADSKLFKNVREKHSLCYNISSNYNLVSQTITINAGIDKSDYEKCVNLIKTELENMKKGNFTDFDLKASKLTYISSLKDIDDFQPSILKIYESHEYLGLDLLEKRSEFVLNVTKDDIINVCKKMHLDTIFILKGGNDEN